MPAKLGVASLTEDTKISLPSGALSAIRVLDLTDERGIYGAKLLADLGAEVVRPAPPGGDPLQQRGPHYATPQGSQSLWHLFFASNRRMATLDLADSAGQARLTQLIDEADVVLACAGAFGVDTDLLDAARRRRPELVVIEASSFGASGPWRDFLAPDLVAGALGGAVATTGDVDTPPLKTFGELNFVLSGTYLAIAALAAVYRQRQTGGGANGHVSVHECIASCLEHVLMWYWYQDHLPNAVGPSLARRGSLHWSNAYVVMPAKGGSIMVTPTPNFDNQLVWLVENDAQQDLLDPKYQEPANRREFIGRVMDTLRAWVAPQDVEELFFEAQRRHSPYGWVFPVHKVAKNPQLEARRWWQPYPTVNGEPLRGPGAPYHFSDTPWRSDAGEAADGFSARQDDTAAPKPSSDVGQDARPLAGVRILDFTHVLAGPFATRILADLGADVVKVNSTVRAGPNAPDGIYYVMWNRNKRALALNMAHDEGRAVAKRLCSTADVVIDNFSVGVLDRWGIGYDAISPINPKAVYVQMSGMGDGGPWSKFVTYAPTIHALAGLTYLTSVPGREDIGIGFSYNDHCAGMHGAFAILAALEARRNTGHGQRIDISQFEVGVNLVGPTLLDYFANGRTIEPTGNTLPYDLAAPHGCFRCADENATAETQPPNADAATAAANERWVAIACMSDEQWLFLRQLMGNPEWARDTALDTAQGRCDCAHLDAKIGAWTRTQTAEQVMHRCQAAGVPAGVVQTGADLGKDPQLRHAGFLLELDERHPVLETTYADRLPIRYDFSRDVYRRTRRVGEDNAAVLADWLGMAEADVRRGEEEGYLV